MPTPFPGMDPYLEISGDWCDFHASFLATLREFLNARLPDPYIARIDERFRVVEIPRDPARSGYPDVAIVKTAPKRSSGEFNERGVLTLDLEPVIVRLGKTSREQIRETWLEIRREPDRELVTSIELLSPTNKEEPGSSDYLAKRADLIAQPVHLVEIDLLIAGRRLPVEDTLPPGDWFAFVSRAEARPTCEVYAWSVRRPLPVIPIPLSRPDPDLLVSLAEVFASTYRTGRYERSIDYARPLDLPLRPEDRIWAEEVARRGT